MNKGNEVFNLPDSGKRRQFETGSKRDLAVGKGRMDLVPSSVLADIYLYLSLMKKEYGTAPNHEEVMHNILTDINAYIYGGDLENIIKAIIEFSYYRYNNIETAILEVSRHFEAGANKYDDRNWEKGQPLHVFIDSGLRHLIRWSRGDDDEPHDSAFLWNMTCLIWTHRRYKELRDLPFNPDYLLGKRW